MPPTALAWRYPLDVRLPSHCARCAAPATSGYWLCGARSATPVPLCGACRKRLRWSMAGWFLATLVGTALGVMFLAVLLELVLPAQGEAVGMIIALPVLALCAAGPFLAWRRRAALFHRVKSPVYLIADTNEVLLGFRGPAFAQATRALGAAGQAGAPKVVPLPPPSYGGPLLVLGVVMAEVAIAVGSYLRLSSLPAADGFSWFEVLALEAGLPVAALAACAGLGVLLLGLGLWWGWRVRRLRGVYERAVAHPG
jgi:hypothetical protein